MHASVDDEAGGATSSSSATRAEMALLSYPLPSTILEYIPYGDHSGGVIDVVASGRTLPYTVSAITPHHKDMIMAQLLG